MHPILGYPQRWKWYLLAWTLAGLVVGVIIRVVLHGDWFAAAGFGLPMGLIAGALSFSAWYVCRAMPAARTPVPRLAATALIAAIVIASIWAGLGQVWWNTLGRMWLTDSAPPSQGLVPLLLVMAGLAYLVVLMAHYAWQAFEDSAAAGRHVLESDVAQRDAELRVLRAQVDPHFLFNSLNSINGLIGSDPTKARVMCQLLGDFLRDSLSLGRSARIPLGREIALARQYLDVEQVRFGQRLHVQMEVSDDTAHVPVPPLLLQPLVENAVRHGIGTLIEGGTIAIQARRAGERVVVVVSNPRDADRTSRGTGFGLDIVRRRLDATFAGDAALVVDSAAETYKVSLTIPIESAP